MIKNLHRMTTEQLLDEIGERKHTDPILSIFAILKELKFRITGKWVRL